MAKQTTKPEENKDQVEGFDFRKLDETDARKLFPLTIAALTKLRDDGADPHKVVLRVTAKKAGFRRAGISHPAEPTDHPLSDFADPARIEAILADPDLVAILTVAETTSDTE